MKLYQKKYRNLKRGEKRKTQPESGKVLSPKKHIEKCLSTFRIRSDFCTQNKNSFLLSYISVLSASVKYRE